GGLNRGQQQAVAEPLIQSARSLHRRLTTGQGGGIGVTYTPQESIEAWRLLGSLELLDSALKTSLGNMLCDLLGKKKLAPARSAMAWAIGRLGSRTPLYGPLNTVISTEVATRWLSTIRSQKETDPMDLLAMMQIARKTDDRYRDLSEPERQTAAKWLTQKSAPQHFREMILTGGTLDHEEQQQVFGESLPVGLTLSV
ncbi:MAG: molecular chaperone DnaK, partial [Blastopirellula sp.]